MAIKLLILLLIAARIHGNTSNKRLTVNTSNGTVLGGYFGITNGGKKPIYAWRSIPFAEPPLGDLRFEAPVPKQNWDGVLDVANASEICFQGSDDDIRGSEDCLYLQIYTTELPKKKANLPVMVWIHGGAFFLGAADFDIHGADNLLDEGVIVVAIHYRVGAFGFLSTGDSVLPGNAGLKDQILALKWIKENIAQFGGDANKITIFGQSAGAASIAYLLQTNKTAGLFHGAILQSGHSLSQWALDRAPYDFTTKVASELKITALTKQKKVQKLKAADAKALQAASVSSFYNYVLTSNALHGLALGPVIEPDSEDAVITGRSYELLQNGEFNKIPVIMGQTSRETVMDSFSRIVKAFLLIYDLNVSRLVPASLNLQNVLLKTLTGSSIKHQYFGNRLIANSFDELLKFVHDDQFERPIQEAAKLYSRHVPTYFYNFSHEGDLYGVTNRNYSGVGHSEDLGYIFDYGYEGSDADYKVRDVTVRLWTNFAKYGNPTPGLDNILGDFVWKPVEGDDFNILQINDDLSLIKNPDSDYLNYWQKLFRERGRAPFSTF